MQVYSFKLEGGGLQELRRKEKNSIVLSLKMSFVIKSVFLTFYHPTPPPTIPWFWLNGQCVPAHKPYSVIIPLNERGGGFRS
jgi:hypothetical protein